jgi:hypothetical protein
VRDEVTLTGFHSLSLGWCFASLSFGDDTHSITLPTIDGKLILGSYTDKDGNTVTIAEIGGDK